MACREKFQRINLDHPDTVFEEILMNRRQDETYCGDLRGDTGAEERTRMSRGRGGKLGRTREIETFLLFPRGKVFMPSILFRPKHAHFSRFNKRNFNGRLPDKNTTNIFEQRIFRFDFQVFFREK